MQKIEVYEGANFSRSYSKVRTNYAVAVVKIADSKPVDLKFKLNENCFKSQEGDIETSTASGTVLISGTDTDDNAFSINAVTRN